MLILNLNVLTAGKFWGYRYTDDSAMTLAIAKSLVSQPAVAVDVRQFDAKNMAIGYSPCSYFSVLVISLVFVILKF